MLSKCIYPSFLCIGVACLGMILFASSEVSATSSFSLRSSLYSDEYAVFHIDDGLCSGCCECIYYADGYIVYDNDRNVAAFRDPVTHMINSGLVTSDGRVIGLLCDYVIPVCPFNAISVSH